MSNSSRLLLNCAGGSFDNCLGGFRHAKPEVASCPVATDVAALPRRFHLYRLQSLADFTVGQMDFRQQVEALFLMQPLPQVRSYGIPAVQLTGSFLNLVVFGDAGSLPEQLFAEQQRGFRVLVLACILAEPANEPVVRAVLGTVLHDGLDLRALTVRDEQVGHTWS